MSQSNVNQSSRSVTRVSLVGILTAVFALLIGLMGPLTTASAAAPPLLQTDMKVLVVASGTGGPTQPYEDLMTRDGIPFQRVAPATATAGFLADTTGPVPRAKFQAVITPDAAAPGSALATYMTTYGIRRLSAVVNPTTAVAMNTAAEQSMDGLVGQVAPAGLAGPFNYLTGPVPFVNIDSSWEYSGWPATPLASPAAGTSMTPLVTLDGTKVLVGVYQAPGIENMIVAFNGNSGQTPFRLLGPGILNWLTQGTHLGLNRNFLSVHADDVLNADALWSPVRNCTPGEDCPVDDPGTPLIVETEAPTVLMTPADVTRLTGWQTGAGVKIDMVYNAQPAVERINDTGSDALTAQLLTDKSQLRWINHTYNHLYFGCTQVNTPPYNCVDQVPPVTDWVAYNTIFSDINSNIAWAAANGVSIDTSELVSGEHSGLADTLPGRVQGDNPNFKTALNALGIKVTGSDNSKEPIQRTIAGTSTLTVPRYPNSIYYNVSTQAESVDEYNWIYGPAADPEGNCVAIPNVTTCMTTMLPSTGFVDYIAPFEARQTLERMLNSDPKPHYAHQSNLAADALVLTWLDLALDGNGAGASGTILGYRDMVNTTNTPIINPTMTQSAQFLTQQASWNAAKNNANLLAYTKNGQAVVTNNTGSPVWVPLSAATGLVEGTQTPWGEAYGGTRSAWTQLAAGATLKVDIGANVAPVASFTSACTQLSCTFTSTSTDVDSEVGSFRYEWNFGDGIAPTTPTNGPTATHAYVANGTFTVTLKVTDVRNASHTATGSVTVSGPPNALPTAVASLVSCTDLTCTFDASKSADPDGSITNYYWDFGDGTGLKDAGATPTYQYQSGGDRTVTVTVKDSRLAQVTSAPVAVKVVAPRVNQAPKAAFTATCAGLTCGFNASASSDDGTLSSFNWTFGDGTAGQGVNPLGHVFPAAGGYVVTLTVSDTEGATGTSSQTVTVSAPVAKAPPASIVKATAVSKKGKLKVDVDPNQKGKGYWKFKVQYQKKDGSWGQYKKTYKTVGKKETKTINFKKGNYRVIVLPKYGLASSTSVVVTLKK